MVLLKCWSGKRLTPNLLLSDNETILQALYPQDNVRLFEPESVMFKCTCNIEKMRAAVKILGLEEVEKIFLTNKTVEVRCDYCNHCYEFDRAGVTAIFQ